MTDKLDGQVLYASDFNAKADKADLDGKQDKITANSSLTLENLAANNELEANKLIVNKIIPSTAQQINLSTAELKAIKSIELNDGTNNVIISPSADGVAFSKTLKVNTPSGNKDAVNKQYVDTGMAKKQNTLVSGTNIKSIKDDKTTTPQSLLGSGSFSFKTINGETLLGSGNISISTGGTITIDDALSATSTNPVQNKVVNSALLAKQDTIKNTDVLTIAGLRASNNSMTLFNNNCVVSMTDDALIINFI